MPLRGVEGNDRAFYGATLVGMDNKPCRCLKPYPGLLGRPELYEPPRIMQDDIKPRGPLWIALVGIASRMPPGITRDDARRTRGATRDMEPSRTPDASWRPVRSHRDLNRDRSVGLGAAVAPARHPARAGTKFGIRRPRPTTTSIGTRCTHPMSGGWPWPTSGSYIFGNDAQPAATCDARTSRPAMGEALSRLAPKLLVGRRGRAGFGRC
ncbi:hypothetical protein BHM03_00030233 [Ensete ventricosum]|nr:hypothetical protein BHM03_00030233 [Ensete ventricosum]